MIYQANDRVILDVSLEQQGVLLQVAQNVSLIYDSGQVLDTCWIFLPLSLVCEHFMHHLIKFATFLESL